MRITGGTPRNTEIINTLPARTGESNGNNMKGKIVPSHHGTELEEKIESKPETVPSELWMLRARNNGKWVRSADDEESCVCQLDEESAKRMATLS